MTSVDIVREELTRHNLTYKLPVERRRELTNLAKRVRKQSGARAARATISRLLGLTSPKS